QERDAIVLPVAVATGADGRIAVADLGRKGVHLFLPAAKSYKRLEGPEGDKLASPVAVVFGNVLRLWVADSAGRVVGYGTDGRLSLDLKAAGGEKLERPTGLAVSPARKLVYVVDTLANRLHAQRANGEAGFSFGERGEALGSFNSPTHIARSRSGE